ncbi:MAG: right-handed parallel beta-helix repeat-containing protein [Fimbriimonadales bacterium]
MVYVVRTQAELSRALRKAQPGDWIQIEASEIAGGLYVEGVSGAPDQPIRLSARHPKRPAVIRGGARGIQLSRCAHWHISDLHFEGQTVHCLNIDDGGVRTQPVAGIRLSRLELRHAGTPGNTEAIKLSGLTEFTLEACRIHNWGREGQGVDIVGCHHGQIRDCWLRARDDWGVGIQTKGGSSQIQIVRCRFEQAGRRAINIGGSTGLDYFRPPLESGKTHAEARAITVERCEFIGSEAPIAFVGVDGALAQYNTFYMPTRWILRILQETTHAGFVPARGGAFRRNIVVFHSARWASGGVNVGANTAPETFQFQENWWYCVDDPRRSQPRLPAPETGGVYGRDPRLRNPESGDLRCAPDSPARDYGACYNSR